MIRIRDISMPAEHNPHQLGYEAAQLLGISSSKMYEVVRIEGFPSIRVGKRVLVNAKRLEAWLDEMTEKGWYIK